MIEEHNGQRRTKRDHVVEQLRALIASGAISRGDRIQQDDLAERFGTSITPVREALLLLEAEGVLIGEPHRGMRVAETDHQRVKANYIMRRLAEGYAMRRAALRVSRLDVEEGRELLDEMRKMAKRGEPAHVSDLNRQFHFLFYGKCGIPGLTREIDALWLTFPWDVVRGLEARAGQSVKEHQAILDAIESGDLDRVEEATAAHLANSHLALMKHLTGVSMRDPFDIHVD